MELSEILPKYFEAMLRTPGAGGTGNIIAGDRSHAARCPGTGTVLSTLARRVGDDLITPRPTWVRHSVHQPTLLAEISSAERPSTLAPQNPLSLWPEFPFLEHILPSPGTLCPPRVVGYCPLTTISP